MDVGPRAHYIAVARMNLFLLISALLSAITGVTAGDQRAPVAAEQVARTAQVTVSATAKIAVRLPAQAIDLVAPTLAAVPLVRLAIAHPPLYASRRRE